MATQHVIHRRSFTARCGVVRVASVSECGGVQM